MNSHNLEKVRTFYAKGYKSADNFDLDTLISMLEKTLKLVKIFSSENAVDYQNHLIANAIMTILYSNYF